MDDGTKAKLEALLQGYDGRLAVRDGIAAKFVVEGLAERDRFVALRETVIAPTMREMGEYLKEHGHDYEIRSSETRDVGAGRNDEPSISLAVFPRGQVRTGAAAAETPLVTFRAGDTPGRLRTQFVKGLRGTSGSEDAGHTYELANVNSELVRREILELLEAVLTRRTG